jgi:NitT/TauT family transport system permease protein
MKHLRLWQLACWLAVVGFWYLMTTPGLLPNVMFDNDRQAAFFFGEPVKVAGASGPGSSSTPTSTATWP